MRKAVQAQLDALGAVIHDERKRLMPSQEDFAEVCDLHRTYIGEIERGEKNVSFENISRIAAAVGLKASVLSAKADL
jgi:transcriptional regulator with XRE-family HTH domain